MSRGRLSCQRRTLAPTRSACGWAFLLREMANTSYLTVSDVARQFSINTATVYRLAQRGVLPGFKVGGQWRFRQDMLESWVADQVTLKWLKAKDGDA